MARPRLTHTFGRYTLTEYGLENDAGQIIFVDGYDVYLDGKWIADVAEGIPHDERLTRSLDGIMGLKN